MNWFWMNIPAALAFVAAWVGIPLWMVLRHPSWGAEPADSSRTMAAAQTTVLADEHGEQLLVPVPVLAAAGSQG
jgi:hypothetical protein